MMIAVFGRDASVCARADNPGARVPASQNSAERRRRAWLLGLYSFVLLAASGCGDPLPEPEFRCTKNEHCPADQRCVAGVCTSAQADAITNDTGTIGDAAPGDTSDGATAACTDDKQCELNAPCVAGVCEDGECQAVQLPSGASCVDDAICPTTGRCTVGYCNLNGKLCDDNESCTFDTCDEGVGCKHADFSNGAACSDDGLSCTSDVCQQGKCTAKLKDAACLIDGTCYGSGDADPKNACNRCIPSDFAEGWTGETSGACDDGDACTSTSVCTPQGLCVGQEVSCDDNNTCTDDGCNSVAGCVYLSNKGTCTDDDPCTLTGQCKDGQCKPDGPTPCDDQNPCTADSCVEGFGCAHAPQNQGNCIADTDPCTDDVCKGGSCVAVPSVAVCKIAGTCVTAGASAANNPCKICSPQLDSKDWTVLDGAQCADGDDCTSFDTCIQGACVGEPSTCNDNNKCTADQCKKIGGCEFVQLQQPCDDSDKCTTDDFCVAGTCAGTALAAGTCDDKNPCTIDVCAPSYGCSSKPHPLPCDDGDKCTKGDLCSAGKCVAGALVCPCEFDSDCNDNNSCTSDHCAIGKGCENNALPGGVGCSDNDKCTSNDKCSGKVCAGAEISCDDKNECTVDSCVAEVGCTHLTVIGQICDDGDKCTAGDLCVDGTCGGTAKNCDDGNACTDDSCNAATAKCHNAAAAPGSACPDDNVPCTVDQCLGGGCNHGEIANGFCLISGACLSGGALHPAKQCTGCKPTIAASGWSVLVGAACKDGNACTVAEVCDEKGSCVGKSADCDDGNVCTKDSCNPQAPGGDGCLHSKFSGACTDDNKCTANDTCADGQCKGTAVVCDDKDACTQDSCTANGGCDFAAQKDGTACPDDGLTCTADLCINGHCRHQVLAGSCRIDGVCVTDGESKAAAPCLGCVPATNPTAWTGLSNKGCTDGNVCTGGDTCEAGKCVGDVAKACDDQNPCTTDTCDTQTGCSHTNNKLVCEDGNACTTKDTCAGGKCVAGEVLQCPNTANAAACETTVCLQDKGCSNVTTCGPQHACNKGLCLTHDGKSFGDVQVTLPQGTAIQPTHPTVLWQESSTGSLGAVPRLWVAAQTRNCSPAESHYSAVFTAVFGPSTSAPTITVLKSLSPTGGPAWCAVDPILRRHPTTFDALVLGWLEGGGVQSGCSLGTTGGQARVGLAGLNGPQTALSVPAKCPSGSPMPHRARPEMLLLTAGPPSNKQDPAQLGGMMLRATSAGPLAYNGNVVGAWGGANGKELPATALSGYTEQPTAVMPSVAAWTTGSAVFSASNFTKSGSASLAGLSVVRLDAAGNFAAKRNVVATGVALTCDQPEYRAIATQYDPDSKRIGTVFSGTCTTNSVHKAFLAFARIHPDQAALAGPKVAIVHDVPKAVGAAAPIAAFRVAQIPNSSHFLVVWAAPGTATLKAIRIEPSDDITFKAVDLGDVAKSFAASAAGVPVASSAGLSELVIDPAGERYSMAWQGVGTLHLLTASLVK